MLVPTRATIVALIALLAVPLAGHPARAADEQSATVLRAEADVIASRYFEALARFESLDREINDNKRVVARLAARARSARVAARKRAVSAYRKSAVQLPSIVGSRDALSAARRVRLLDNANQRDETLYAELRRTTRGLKARRRSLVADRRAQAGALAALREQGSAMEAKLALAQQREQAALAVQTLAAAQPVAEPATTTPTPESTLAATTTTTTTTTTLPPPKVVTPPPPPNYVGTPGVYLHHDDPFLTCVRTRESGGNYSAVNPAGPWLGAYQFLQATWDAAANHGGLTKLVGVPANLATAYDQDNVAWVLYQWQGAAPWGGACP